MNKKHLIIKFTFEYEHNNSFLFLDVKICRENNELTFSVYRKPQLLVELFLIPKVLYPQFTNSVYFTYYYIVALILHPLIKHFLMNKLTNTNFKT